MNDSLTKELILEASKNYSLRSDLKEKMTSLPDFFESAMKKPILCTTKEFKKYLMKKKLNKTSKTYEFHVKDQPMVWLMFENYKITKYPSVELVLREIQNSLQQNKILIKNIQENKVYSKDYFLQTVVPQIQQRGCLDVSGSDNSKFLPKQSSSQNLHNFSNLNM